MKRWPGEGATAVLLAVALAGLGGIVPTLSGLERYIRVPAGAGSPADSLLGQARVATSSFLWQQVENTLHAGAAVGTACVDKHPMHDDHAAPEGAPPAGATMAHAPSPRADFRGFLGELESQIHPTFAAGGHYHENPEKTIPLFRLMTWANPYFVSGYTVGANILCDAGRHVGEAIAFLQEGEHHNPFSIEIQTELGRYFVYYLRHYALAEQHLHRALDLARGRDAMPPDEAEAVWNAYRWLALAYQAWGKHSQAVAVAKEGRRRVGPDIVLDGVLRQSHFRSGG
ncbi:MAG: hypothetical protein HY320_14835 [Armatimonadetes bacterium]|nr:hypothetical protein [Armatimonadota bacterium]